MEYLIRGIDAKLHKALEAKSKRTGRTMKHIILAAIRKEVKCPAKTKITRVADATTPASAPIAPTASSTTPES